VRVGLEGTSNGVSGGSITGFTVEDSIFQGNGKGNTASTAIQFLRNAADVRIRGNRLFFFTNGIVIDAGTGRVLWQRRPHQRMKVASLTKIMTALLAFRKLGPNDIVTVDKSVPRVPLVREGLRAGERVKAWKLFYSLLLYSGNDDALALAIAAGGDKWTFVHEMNDEAHRLGLRDTHFVSPSGVVDRDNYSSAWDVAALSRVAMRNARFDRVVRTKIIHVPWSAPTYSKVYVNNNLMLRSYAGANGLKTGYTHKSGDCLAVSATRHGRTLIAVLLDDPNMYVDGTRLLNFGFSAA